MGLGPRNGVMHPAPFKLSLPSLTNTVGRGPFLL